MGEPRVTGLELFLLVDAALLAAFIHWQVWRRPGRSDRAPGEPARRTARTTAPAPASKATDLNAFTGKVYVIDGDTITVGPSRVRLFGMDAPETDQRGGAAAKSHLIGLAGGREVRVEPKAVDRYGRIVGQVRLGALDLSEAMVLDGFAVATRRYHRDYVAAEHAAREARRGLWKADPVSGIGDPARHRREKAAREAGGAGGNRVAFSRRPAR